MRGRPRRCTPVLRSTEQRRRSRGRRMLVPALVWGHRGRRQPRACLRRGGVHRRSATLIRSRGRFLRCPPAFHSARERRGARRRRLFMLVLGSTGAMGLEGRRRSCCRLDEGCPAAALCANGANGFSVPSSWPAFLGYRGSHGSRWHRGHPGPPLCQAAPHARKTTCFFDVNPLQIRRMHSSALKRPDCRPFLFSPSA